MAAFPFLCVSLQRTASEGRGAATLVCDEGWESPRAGHQVIGVPDVCTISKTDGTSSDAVDSSGPFLWRLAMPCHALPCCPALPSLCLLLELIPPRTRLFLPSGGNLPHMQLLTHLERLGVMPGVVPRLIPSRRTCVLLLHHSWLVAGLWG